MRNPPPEEIAKWPRPNYVNPESQGQLMPIIGIIFVVLSVVVVALRLWVRVHMKRAAGLDDWVMLATMPFIIASTVSTIMGTHYGWGIHIWDNKLEWSQPSRLTSWLSQVFFIIIMTLVKLSIISSYLRISATETSKLFHRLSWATLVLVSIWGLFCRPLHHYWTALTDETCIKESKSMLGATVSNIITDLIVLALPIPTFWRLQLPMRERLVLITMMSLGLMYGNSHSSNISVGHLLVLACAASCVRCYYMYVVLDLTYDVTWYGYKIWVWNAIEVNLAVICASIPTLRPFAKKYFPRMGFKTSMVSRSKYGTQRGTLQSSGSGIYKEHTLHQVVEHSSTEELHQAMYPMSPISSRHR
ncbi:hypothetical protein FQN55_002544 [Onygenales sp. PD_40]|nr:hypothetical protein FQN55_002544 [Onygenales sp. PD_40]KAK2798171.1 hypothetical protein FQN51_007857 [Onygenales sp. PD_10]